MISGHKLSYPFPDRFIVGLFLGINLQLFKLSKKFRFVKLDRLADVDQAVCGLLHPFLLHQHFLIQLFSGAKPDKLDLNILSGDIAG